VLASQVVHQTKYKEKSREIRLVETVQGLLCKTLGTTRDLDPGGGQTRVVVRPERNDELKCPSWERKGVIY